MKVFEVIGPDGLVYCVTAATSKHNANAVQLQFFTAGRCVLDTGFVEVKGTMLDLLRQITFLRNMDAFFHATKTALNMNFHRYWQRVAGEPGSWGLNFYAANTGTTTNLLFHSGDTAVEIENVTIETSVMDAALEIAKTRPDLSHFVNLLSHE